MRNWSLLLLGIFCISNTFAQPTAALFEEGNTHYNAGTYQEAIAAYKAVLAADKHSAALYFNLGNAYYKLNEVAESIYYYEKALQLAPEDPDILHNIKFAKNMTLDAIEELPQTQLAALQEEVLQGVSLQQLSYGVVLFLWLAVAVFMLYIVSRKSSRKRLAFSISILFLTVAGLSFYAANKSLHQKESIQFGIVFSEEIQLYNEPNNRAEAAFLLHQGVKVQIIDSLQDWQKIKIANGAEGWVKGAIIRAL